VNYPVSVERYGAESGLSQGGSLHLCTYVEWSLALPLQKMLGKV